jgi:hypothetical protein
MKEVHHHHIEGLQSVPGIAAAIGVFHHSSYLLPTAPNLRPLTEAVCNALKCEVRVDAARS